MTSDVFAIQWLQPWVGAAFPSKDGAGALGGPGVQAQWCLFDPMISAYYGAMAWDELWQLWTRAR